MSGAKKEPKMTLWQAPSRTVHSLRSCSDGPGVDRMVRVRYTRAQFEVAVRCRCALDWRPTAGPGKVNARQLMRQGERRELPAAIEGVVSGGLPTLGKRGRK